MEQKGEKSGMIFKGSKGVNIFAILLLGGALFILLHLIFSPTHGLQCGYRKPFDLIALFLTYIFTFLQIFLAIHILRLKEWARKEIVNLMRIYLFLLLLSYGVMDHEKIETQQEKMIQDLQNPAAPEAQKNNEEFIKKMEEDIKSLPPERQESIRQFNYKLTEMTPVIIKIVLTIISLLPIMLYTATIFFFTRPKVKEQFAGPMPEKISSPPAKVTAKEEIIEGTKENITIPFGIKLICSFFILNIIGSLVPIISELSGNYPGPKLDHLPIILMTAINLALCIGIIKRRRWARIGVIFLYSFVSISAFVSIANPSQQSMPFLLAIILFLLSGTILFYLTRPKIKAYFKTGEIPDQNIEIPSKS